MLALQLSGGISYFSKEKETKMKQIMGKNIDSKSAKQIIASILKAPNMTFDEHKFISILQGFQEMNSLAKETFECAFIALLRKSENVLEVTKKTMVEFIQESSRSAMDLTATGMAFPLEMELLEYSESEDNY